MIAKKPPFSPVDPALERYRPIASLVSGEPDPPSWLIRHSRGWAPPIMMAQAIDFVQPKRSELVKQMRDVQAACRGLEQAITHGPTTEFLDLLPPSPFDVAMVRRVLADLQARSERPAHTHERFRGDRPAALGARDGGR